MPLDVPKLVTNYSLLPAETMMVPFDFRGTCLALCVTTLWLALPRIETSAEETPAAWVPRHLDQLVALYQHLHQHPELSFKEEKTSQRLAQEWRSLGATVTCNVGGHGIVGLIRNGTGTTLMLRTDMDALPVTEQTGLNYASQVRTIDQRGVEVGVMHACGHDMHMALVTGAAAYLAANRGTWQGTVVLVGQPAEERGAGAQAMLADGLFQRFPRPDYALALHVDAGHPAGHVGYRAGYSLANVDSVDITILGRGGHGAYPHTTVDPVVIAARLILDLQTIISREIQPIQPAVITVGSIHSGSKHNVIADKCHLQLTVRSYSDQVRQQLHEAIRRKATAAAASAEAPEPEVKISVGTPSLWNDPQLTARLVPIFQQTLGPEKVAQAEPSMGGEDFSRYGKAGVPLLMVRLGAVSPKRLADYRHQGQQPPSLHSSRFFPDVEETLTAGITLLATAALELLAPTEPAHNVPDVQQ